MKAFSNHKVSSCILTLACITPWVATVDRTATPQDCLAQGYSWGAPGGRCVPLPIITGANCTWPQPSKNEYATLVKWTVVNACKSRRPLLVATLRNDDVGSSYAEGWDVLPFGAAKLLTLSGSPYGSEAPVVFSTCAAGGGGGGSRGTRGTGSGGSKLSLGAPLTSCGGGDVQLGGSANANYCLVAGGDVAGVKFTTAHEFVDPDNMWKVEGRVAGAKKVLKSKRCDKSLHPGAVALQMDPFECRPGCGAELKLTLC